MAKWKPTFWRTNGRPGATAPMRKLGRKFIDNMKHRNEELGNYINPVQRFQYDGIKFVMSSLPGYDIIDITVPFVPSDEEERGTAEIYSGLWEPRFQSHSLQHYIRWYPSDYELYNSDSITPVGLGASVDGAADTLLTAPMPPNRWMQNDYAYDPEDPTTREEAPWFKDSGPTVSKTSIHPGKYSGKLRELVQMQLGYGLLPQFSYTASDSNGIHLEPLDEDTTRIWLYQISATNGVVAQIMMDYSVTSFESAADLKTGNIPPEIEEAGFMALQTSFDTTKPLYTKAEWDALPDDERPGITTVTFELLSAASYLAVTSEYGAYGDYGWSFNPAGTRAVLCGMAWNTPGGGGLAPNYKSNILTVSINMTAYTATVSGAGDNAFLMDSSFDHVKFPNANGTLETVYFWKGENGFKGTQPSNSYTSPIYTYYNLNGELVTCSYTWVAGVYQNKDPGVYDPLGYSESFDCRELTTWGFDNSADNYHYKNCSTASAGEGTYGHKHGFVTQITTPDSYDIFSGGEAKYSGVHTWGNRDQSKWFTKSFDKVVIYTPILSGKAYINADEQYIAHETGDFSGSSKSVLIIPSFERLAYFHYKEHNSNVSGGQLRHPHTWVLERGTPARQNGQGFLGDPCENAGCGEGLGSNATLQPDHETAPEYYFAGTPQEPGGGARGFIRMSELFTACAGDGTDCFFGSDNVEDSTPADVLTGYSRSTTTYTGGLKLPDGSSIAFSEDEIVNQSEPFRESSSSFGYQSVISCFDTFSSKYIFTMPNIALTATKRTATGFPDDITKTGVLFSGMPYFIG